jgi:hypothetical protein
VEKLSYEKQKQESEERLRYEAKKEQVRLKIEQRELQEKARKEQFEQQNKGEFKRLPIFYYPRH